MKTLKSITTIVTIVAMQMLTSCLGSGNSNYTVNTKFPGLFNAVVTEDEVTLYPNQSIQVQWKYGDDLVAEVQVIGLQLPGTQAFPSLQFNDKPWNVNEKGWMEIKMSNAKPDATTGYVSDLTFNNFVLQTINRTYNNLNFPPCINIKYTINDKFTVYALPSEIVEVGKTTVTNLEDNTSFVQADNSRAIYYIELDPATRKAFLVIQGAQFAQNMPGLNMKFPNIPFEVDKQGHIILKADEIEPMLLTSTNITDAGTPAPNYPITNFRAECISDYGVVISFICTPHTKDGQEMGKYHVSFSCQYPTSSQGAVIL